MRALALLSGGIDSPVAAYLIARKGIDVDLVHFDNRPFTEEDYVERVRSLGRILASVTGREFKLYVLPHGGNQSAIGRECERRYQCVLCRRMMLRTAGELANREGYDVLVTGDSVGQVASQTVENLLAENPASPVQIIRPLIAMDKEEIISIAVDIGTFETSTLPGVCCMMAPPKPATRSELRRIVAEEEGLGAEELVKKSIGGSTIDVLNP
jgi:thiamine biosynthesis protein ThiI